MHLLGEDGLGYELAKKLESCGVWRNWLGDSLYSDFARSLSSPSVWESFMSADSKSKPQIQLQLRARALLFDKATITHNLPPGVDPSSVTVSQLNPEYLMLHGDEVYHTLDEWSLDGGAQQREVGNFSNSAKNQYKSTVRTGSRFGESEFGNPSQRFRNDEFPENWYDQFIKKYRAKSGGMSISNPESDQRTPEGMSAYIKLCDEHKRRRVAIKKGQPMGSGSSVLDNRSSTRSSSALDDSNPDDELIFFPETMFPLNCVPESALPPPNEDDQEEELFGALDTLPEVKSRPVMTERLGVVPDNPSMAERGGSHAGKIPRKGLSDDQERQMSRKVIAQMLTNVGFEGSKENLLEVFSQVLSQHALKLGRTLKILTDNYSKQCSEIEIIRMFLQTTGNSDVESLMELVKVNPSGSGNLMQQTQINPHTGQLSSESQQQSSLRLPQQIPPRQMHIQMQQQQMVHPLNVALHQQQQLDRMRRREPSTPRSANIDIDKDRPMVQVKLESPSDNPMDSNVFNSVNARQAMQFRQQQMAAMSNLHMQSNNQFRQLASIQIPQSHSPNMGIARAPPVKVEGFQELMGGDSSSQKHDSEENKMKSPSGK